MNEPRSAITQFCDDIRHEVGNKYSLMGCYGSELFTEKLPIVLPKLCAQVRVRTPIDRPFAQLKIRAMFKDELVAELATTSEELRKLHKKSPSISEATMSEIVAMLVLSPLEVLEAGTVRIEVETEEGLIKGGFLYIRDAVPQGNT